MNPLLITDIDDVFCLNDPYGAYDVAQRPWPDDLLSRIWHPPALAVLEPIVTDLKPRIVVTSSWLRLMLVTAIGELLRASGHAWFADALHPQGEALQARGTSRLNAIDAWLAQHHEGEPYAILDDHLSGDGLAGSLHEASGRLIMCDVNVGLLPEHGVRIRRALTTPVRSAEPGST